jgi:hypothetical protein
VLRFAARRLRTDRFDARAHGAALSGLRLGWFRGSVCQSVLGSSRPLQRAGLRPRVQFRPRSPRRKGGGKRHRVRRQSDAAMRRPRVGRVRRADRHARGWRTPRATAASKRRVLETWCFSPIAARSRRRACSRTEVRSARSPPGSLALGENHQVSRLGVGLTGFSVSLACEGRARATSYTGRPNPLA